MARCLVACIGRPAPFSQKGLNVKTKNAHKLAGMMHLTVICGPPDYKGREITQALMPPMPMESFPLSPAGTSQAVLNTKF